MMREFAEAFQNLRELLSKGDLTGADLQILVAINRRLLELWSSLTGPSR